MSSFLYDRAKSALPGAPLPSNPSWSTEVNRYNLLHISVQGGATSFILSGTDLKSLFSGILMFEIGMIPQKLKWLASLQWVNQKSMEMFAVYA